MPTFTNQATLTFNNASILSNVATGEILDVLTMTKGATPLTYAQNEDITYVIHLTNTSASPLTGVTITDNLGAYSFEPIGYPSRILTPLTYKENTAAFFINGVQQPSPTAEVVDNNLVISGLNIPGNANATVAYIATTNEYADANSGETITNIATVTGGGLTEPLTDSATITARDAANLMINKSVTPTQVLENGRVTYRFEISNYGNTETLPTDSLVLTDRFNPILSDLSVTYEGAAWTAPTNYTYTTDGLFTTVENAITLDAATITQDPATGLIETVPSTVVLEVTGTI